MVAFKLSTVPLCVWNNFLVVTMQVCIEKGRLSVHRKNEFRKRRAERRGIYTVTLSNSFPIPIPTTKVNLFTISLPKEHFFNIKLKTLDMLKDKINSSFILPEGLTWSALFKFSVAAGTKIIPMATNICTNVAS